MGPDHCLLTEAYVERLRPRNQGLVREKRPRPLRPPIRCRPNVDSVSYDSILLIPKRADNQNGKNVQRLNRPGFFAHLGRQTRTRVGLLKNCISGPYFWAYAFKE